MRLGEVADPVAQSGEAVVDVEFAALNPADRYLSLGQYPARPVLPHVLGRDGMGRISALGSGVSGFAVGQKVLIRRGETGVTRWGTFAQRVAVDAECLSPIPAGWSDAEAAGAALVYLTAWQALKQWGELPAGSVILITGASGGVGVAALQLAKCAGQVVIALSRSSDKQAKLRVLGAEVVLSPEDADWKKKSRDALGGKRVDLAIDNIGGAFFPDVVESLADGGRISVVGRLAGPVPQFNTASLLFHRLKIGGVAVGAYSRDENRAAWEMIVKALAQRGYKALVDSVWKFAELKEAFARLEGGPMGKVVLETRV